jgi:hypothetical protein
MKKQVLISVFLMTSAILCAQIIHVPADQPTIQAGIDAATTGDTVLVAEGTYLENINFMGKAITVASHFIVDADTNHINNTIIDGSMPAYPDSAACVMFVHGEDTTSILSGFTLTGGSGVWTTGFNVRSGGGVFAFEAGAKILNNKIMYNLVESDSGGGAGLQFLGGDAYWAVIDNNTISHNTSISDGYSAFGAGMSILVNAIIKNNLIEHNTCTNTNQMADGGGIELELWEPGSNQHANVYNNIIRFNTLDANNNAIGGGICSFGVPCEIRNNEIYNNESLAGNRCLGGGLRILSTKNKVLIEGNNIYANKQNGEYVQGGGIDVGLAADTVIIKDNMIWENDISATTAAWGSGIVFVKDSFLFITDNLIYENQIAGNSWWCGAGLYAEATYNFANISNNCIYNNTGTGTSYGGGVGFYNNEGASYNIESNLIHGNHCNYGGGLWTFNTFDISVTNNIFAENIAWSWGGAYALRHATDDNPIEISIAHSLKENSTLKLPKQNDHPVVVNNTFYANDAGDSGGAIDSDQRDHVPIFFNCIFWENTAPTADNIYLFVPDTIYISHCDIDTSASSIHGNFTGHGNFSEDPCFEPGDSLCHINGGPCNNSGIGELNVQGIMYYAPDHDYDGDPRPQGPGWEIGADEILGQGIFNEHVEISRLKIKTNPNPTSGIITIHYEIHESGAASLSLMNIRGEMIITHQLENQTKGENTTTLNLSHLPDGVYLLRLQAGKEVETTKVILQK